MKLAYRNYLMILLCLLLINVPYISQTSNNLFTLAIEIILILTLRSFKWNILRENKWIVLFSASIVLCTIINLGVSTRTINAVVTGLRYVLIFYTIFFIGQKYTVKYVIFGLRKFLIVMVILADLSVLVAILTNSISAHGGVYNTYIIGNKFVVSYYHMFLLALYQINTRSISSQGKTKYIAFAMFSVFVCYSIRCNTGVVGCAVVILIHIFSIKKNCILESLSNPMIFCAIFIGLNFLLVGTDFLLKDSFITDLLMKYSHTNKILTGRFDMYAVALHEFSKSPLIGYGINCTIVEDILTWGNAQNGLLKIMLDYGLFGAGSFFVVCFSSMKQKRQMAISTNTDIRYGIISYLYGMLVCSLVEINITPLFVVAFALYNLAKQCD